MKPIFKGILLILVLNFLLNLWIIKFNSKISLSDNYWGNHHFFADQRVNNGEFNLLRAWGQTDSQWYLKIASEGYGNLLDFDMSKKIMSGLSYAYFPFYPLMIRFFALFTGSNYELAAFVLNNLLMVICWASIYFVVGEIYSKKQAFLTATLIMIFPFSLFLRSYHSEGLYLLELTWWLYFLSKKKMLPASLALAAMNITKGTGWLLNLVFLVASLQEMKAKRIKPSAVFVYMLVALAPIFVWIGWVYLETGDPLFFYKAVGQWKVPGLHPLIYNLVRFGLVGEYILSGAWVNVLQTVVYVASIWILVVGRSVLKWEWWWTSLLLLLVPTLTTYSLGYTSGRLAVVQLPLWVYFASRLGKVRRPLVVVHFLIILFWGSLYFVNWYWWG